jgi:hypothetical protein
MKWEYRVWPIAFVELKELERGLNTLFGADGWELVAVVPSVIPGYPPGKDNLRSAAIFKRQADKGPASSN